MFKKILMIILSILMIPLGAISAIGISWYTLPTMASTSLGIWLLSNISTTAIFWLTLVSTILYIVFAIMQKIFNRDMSAKIRNLFIYLDTWLIAGIILALSLYTFIVVNPLLSNSVSIDITRKIGIGVCVALLLLFHLFGRKIWTIVNRKIQSYESAKEQNVVGRSSVIFINFLKLLEVLFPEMLVLILLCLCTSWNVASYFILVLAACVVPIIGNIASDLNTRKEIKRKKEIEQQLFVDKVANKLKEEEL